MLRRHRETPRFPPPAAGLWLPAWISRPRYWSVRGKGQLPKACTSIFNLGDAMALSFPDGSFDVVMSTFGAIFAPDPEKTAAEMAQVCRPGGKIAMANWTPEGMLGKLFRLLARYSPTDASGRLGFLG